DHQQQGAQLRTQGSPPPAAVSLDGAITGVPSCCAAAPAVEDAARSARVAADARIGTAMVRWLRWIALLAIALALLLVLLAWWLLRGSLPALDGELALAGLSAPVTVQRDALGVV